MNPLCSLPLPRLAAACLLSIFLAVPAVAFDGQLRTPQGKPAAGYQVSVVGTTVTVSTNAEGRFRIVPSPAVPFLLVATAPGGAVSAPLEVTELGEVNRTIAASEQVKRRPY